MNKPSENSLNTTLTTSLSGIAIVSIIFLSPTLIWNLFHMASLV
jgi:hypothetical protein